MIEVVGCILLGIIGIGFVLMIIDEIRFNYEARKMFKDDGSDNKDE